MTTTSPRLAHNIIHRPDFAFLTVHLQQGEKVYAEPSAMASMDPTIVLKSSLKGGLLKSFKRGVLGGESFIMNTFTAANGPGEVTFAPGPMGDLVHYRLDGSCDLLVQRGGYVASSEGVDIDSQWQGLMRGFFNGEGLFLLKCSGDGDVFFNTYGAILEIDVTHDYYVDNSYVVAFESTLDYQVTTLPGMQFSGLRGIKNFVFGGEFLVCRFTGQGKLWLQTRTIGPFLNWIYPYRPQRNNN